MDLTSILNYEEFIHGFWQQWFFTEAPLGREIFQNNNRLWINSFDDFKSYIIECKKSVVPCWLTVQPYKARDQPAMVEKLYFDFDSSNLPLAWHEVAEFYHIIKEFYNAESLICFSGNKGYNIYVWLKAPVKLEDQNQMKEFYKTAQSMLLKGLKFKTLDPQPIGDIKRFSRVPYSIHQETKNPCVIINTNHNPILISELNAYRKHGLSSRFTDLCLKQLKKHSDFKLLKMFIESRVKIRPCIKAALNKTLDGQSGHLIRLAITREFLAAGYNVDDVVQLFRSQLDYSPEKTRYYVEHAHKNHAKPFKCQTIQRLGYCLGKACPTKR